MSLQHCIPIIHQDQLQGMTKNAKFTLVLVTIHGHLLISIDQDKYITLLSGVCSFLWTPVNITMGCQQLVHVHIEVALAAASMVIFLGPT